MNPYPKIQSIYKRDEETHKFLEGQWSVPEFEYLANNQWEWTEKVDGMNMRVIWHPINFGNGVIRDSVMDPFCYPSQIEFKGKTDNAQIPPHLLEKLKVMFPIEKFTEWDYPITLYGEGYGYKIQHGGKYLGFDVSFVLFDVWIDGWWLQKENIRDIASKLGIDVVPTVLYGTIHDAIWKVRDGFKSRWGDFPAEGLVGKPLVELHNRKGERIVTKLKTKDFVR